MSRMNLGVVTALAAMGGMVGLGMGDSPSIDRERLAMAIRHVESSDGTNCAARFEPGFLKKYGAKHPMPELRKLYGDQAAASSYGPYQIMICRAWELGFKESPEWLAVPENNKLVFDKLLDKSIRRYGDRSEEPVIKRIAGRYNGSGETGRYAQKVWSYYAQYHN